MKNLKNKEIHMIAGGNDCACDFRFLTGEYYLLNATASSLDLGFPADYAEVICNEVCCVYAREYVFEGIGYVC